MQPSTGSERLFEISLTLHDSAVTAVIQQLAGAHSLISRFREQAAEIQKKTSEVSRISRHFAKVNYFDERRIMFNVYFL